jgi:thiol-disulfide isomerase/thioredoxin
MKPALMALGALVLLAQQPGVVVTPPPALPAGALVDAHDSKALLLGETTAKAILAHRAAFRDNLAKVSLTPELKTRWKAIRQPFTLVAVFGSWCGDSHRHLPDLLALQADPNPFFEVHYLGVDRDKMVQDAVWPKGCAPQQVTLVPTFYLFVLQPGGKQQLAGSVVETPPRDGQTMAEALVELVEAAGKVASR